VREGAFGRPSSSGGRRTVLLIDDNAPIERLITLVLGGGGYDVIAARSGAEALDLLAEKDPALILCDLQLPDIDGYEVLRRVRSDPRLRDVPVVAFTVMVLADDVERIRSAGFDGHIAKPIHPDTFLMDIASFFSD